MPAKRPAEAALDDKLAIGWCELKVESWWAV